MNLACLLDFQIILFEWIGLIVYLGCGNLTVSVYCVKTKLLCTFWLNDWKAAKYAILVNMSHCIRQFPTSSRLISDFFCCLKGMIYLSIVLIMSCI